MADALFARAGSPVKRVVKIEGGTHSSARVGTEEYRQAVREFMLVAAPPLSTAAGTAAAGALD
jgi:hypothetical protein